MDLINKLKQAELQAKKIQKNPQLESFLAKISKIESSDNPNAIHKIITSGMHKGDRAIGQYGLMPKTIDELVNRNRDLKITPEEARERAKVDPEFARVLATRLANLVLKNQSGNEEAAAYSWNQGHNLEPEQITPELIESSDYIKKYRALNKPSRFANLKDEIP